MKWLAAVLLCFLPITIWSQTFSANGNTIPDYANARYFFLQVPALTPTSLSPAHGLTQVCIDITHPHVADLVVFLLAPDGTQVELVSGAGGAGGNFSGTCFSMKASTTIISGSAPFSGLYYPRHNLGACNNGSDGTGVWNLVIQDIVKGDSGVLNSWALTFDTAAPAPSGIPVGPCSKFNVPGCGCPDSTQSTCLLLPDMFIGESWFLDTIRRREFRDSITVSNSTANIGWGPMEIIGTNRWFCADSEVAGNVVCSDGGYSRQLVQQRIYKKTANGFFDFMDTVVGYMRFHSELGHHHLHVEDWVENTLRIRGPESNPELWPVIGRGYKVSVSLYDHIRCDTIFGACDYADSVYQLNALRNAGLGAGYTSGSAQVQGISVGFSDVYEYLLPFGQAIYFDSICNGEYVLMSQFDPHHRFVDGHPENNITYGVITLTKQRPACCTARFDIDTINWQLGIFRFVDRSVAMPSEWHWNFGDGDTSVEQFPIHQFRQGGAHTVQLSTFSSSQQCAAYASRNLVLRDTLFLADLTAASWQAEVWPNPGEGPFTLRISSNEPTKMQLVAYDALGGVVPSLSVAEWLPASAQNRIISLPYAGCYWLKITCGTTTKVLPVVRY
ncbi:MAG: proprotein convertase P-domain-containing protein [Chitinophagales bacterium]